MDRLFLMKRFLRKLINLEIWGGRHTELKNLRKAIPRHLRGEKVTEEAIMELVELGFLMIKLSIGERHVSLNPDKKKEIHEFLTS